MSTTTKQEEMQSVEMKPEEMQSEEVKSEEMQPEMQLPVSDIKPKRFALKPRKRSASEQMMLSDPKQSVRWQNKLDTNYMI